MSEHLHADVHRHTGVLQLDRPRALNALSLPMVRGLSAALCAWRDDARVAAVVIRSRGDKGFCAGGDIRFFHAAGQATPQGGCALLEDFFSEEYALNYLIHTYPKPYIALLDGVVMGGGMGLAQASPPHCLRIVTERTAMAMPETAIGLFPDVGASFFLSRAPGHAGRYLGLTGHRIGAADALHLGLADLFVPSARMGELTALIGAVDGARLRAAIERFAAPFQSAVGVSPWQAGRDRIDRHFGAASVAAIGASLVRDDGDWARRTLAAMARCSPLMMSVTLDMLARGAALGMADCLRMERALMRRSFERGEVLEGVRALAIDKDRAPRWSPPTLAGVDAGMVAQLFAPVWPPHAHPLRDLGAAA